MQYNANDDGGASMYRKRERMVYDGKRMRKAVVRKTVDYTSSTMTYLWNRPHFLGTARPALQPSMDYFRKFELQGAYRDNPAWGMCTKFVHIAVNKVRTPINCVTFTPDARRLITGTHSGEFTLWNALTFNFETILQAHNESIRRMVWTHNGMFLVSSCDGGVVKYWQSSMNNVQAFTAHKESIRDLSFASSDLKFATACDDQTVGVWDFETNKQEHSMIGHRWNVRSVDWHPTKSLLVSGSKDNTIKLWDPKAGKEVRTLSSHKHTVIQVRWNRNGVWFVSVGRDQLAKVWDIRKLKHPLTCRGHNKEVMSVRWHPQMESLFATGGFGGNVKYWLVGSGETQAEILGAHDGSIWDMAWHPLGHMLVTGSNDHSTRWWTRNRPGDEMDDKYNVNQLPEEQRREALEALAQMARMNPRQAQMAALQDYNFDEDDADAIPKDPLKSTIPGMGVASEALERKDTIRRELGKLSDYSYKRRRVQRRERVDHRIMQKQTMSRFEEAPLGPPHMMMGGAVLPPPPQRMRPDAGPPGRVAPAPVVKTEVTAAPVARPQQHHQKTFIHPDRLGVVLPSPPVPSFPPPPQRMRPNATGIAPPPLPPAPAAAATAAVVKTEVTARPKQHHQKTFIHPDRLAQQGHR